MSGTPHTKAAVAIPASDSRRYQRSAIGLGARQFVRNRAAVVGLIALLALVTVSALARVVSPYDPTIINLSQSVQPPSLTHLLGTDYFGRDMLSRVMLGGQVSLSVGL